MGGYVTQSRIMPYLQEMTSSLNYGPGVNSFRTWDPARGDFGPPGRVYGIGQYPVLPLPHQTTTSYRTRGTEDVDEFGVVSATSEIDFIRRLQNEKSNDRTSPYDTGHTFFTQQTRCILTHPWIDTNPQGQVHSTPGAPYISSARYVGPLVPDLSPYVAPSPFGPVSPTDLTWGTKAIADSLPTNSVANLSVALAELYREGLPRLIGSRLLSLSSFLSAPGLLAHEVLNWEFGYKPLANDLSKLLLAVSESNRLIQQYVRDSGQMVRRRRSFPTQFSAKGQGSVGSRPLYNPGAYWDEVWDGGTDGQVTWHTESYDKYWFSGGYTYTLPLDSSRLERLSRWASLAEKVTGLSLTPEALWNLMPWSWLADWIWDIGDIIHNISGFATDSLVLKYGYLMHESFTKYTWTHPGAKMKRGNASVPTGPISISYVNKTKERVRATPYGFGLNPNSFTDLQWSILASLGISKGSAHVLH